jgi:PAS domain S-box-containing protein
LRALTHTADLLEARDHLRAVSDSMSEALCTLDDAGHVSYMNAAAERLLGWRVGELCGLTLHDAVHYRRADGSAYPACECPLTRGHRDREVVRVDDDMFVRRDGSEISVSAVLTPFHSETGNNSVIVFEHTSQDRPSELQLVDVQRHAKVRELREALEEDRFELFAQPIVELRTGTIVSHELLLRMHDRDGTIRRPDSFLPAAERYGLIGELDRWVIRQVAQLAGDGHRVELNLSATSLGDPALFDHFASAISEYRAEPARMVVEITETAILHDEAIARCSSSASERSVASLRSTTSGPASAASATSRACRCTT